MKIDRVHVQNYKSLSDVDVMLHPQVTVLVGPNGSGKSNFVDAIELMRDLGHGDGTDAIRDRGGVQRMIQQNARFNGFCEITTISEGVESTVQYEIGGIPNPSWIAYESSLVAPVTKKWIFPKADPTHMRVPQVTQNVEVLNEDALNWVEIYKANPDVFKRGIEALQKVLPDLTHIEVAPAGNSYLFPVFHFKSKNDEAKKFDAAQLSDGTLHLWGLLLSLYQQPSPDLIVIEEPELYLHPGVLGLFADCVKEVSEVTQIILTTHSPHLVNKFTPEQIRVVSMVNGSTQISNIHANQKEAVEEGLMSLGEFMSAEGLRPAQG